MVNIDGLCMVLKCNEEELLLRIAKQPGSYRGIIPSEIQKIHWGIYELSCLYLRKLIYYAACTVPYGVRKVTCTYSEIQSLLTKFLESAHWPRTPLSKSDLC